MQTSDKIKTPYSIEIIANTIVRASRRGSRWFLRSTLSSPPTAGIAVLGALCILVEITRWQDNNGSLWNVSKTVIRAFVMVMVSLYLALVNTSIAYAFLVLSVLQAHKQLGELIIPYYNCQRGVPRG